MRQIGNWLISTLAWGPLLLWVIWPRFDARLAWHPLVGYSGVIALALTWIYSGFFGLVHKRWTAFVAVPVAFSASFSVAAHASDIGTFTAVSIAGGGFVSGIVSGLIVVVAVCVSRVQDYGALEDTILMIVPLIEAAMIAGITGGAIVASSGRLFVGLAAGLGASAIVSIFVLSWVYGVVGITAALVERHSTKRDLVWWEDGYS